MNYWLMGKIEQARLLLQDGRDLFEVGQLLDMSLEKIEDIFLRYTKRKSAYKPIKIIY